MVKVLRYLSYKRGGTLHLLSLRGRVMTCLLTCIWSLLLWRSRFKNPTPTTTHNLCMFRFMKLFPLCLAMSKAHGWGTIPKCKAKTQTGWKYSYFGQNCKQVANMGMNKRTESGDETPFCTKTGCQWKEVCYSVFPGSGLFFLPL